MTPNPTAGATLFAHLGFRLRNLEGGESRPLTELQPSINGIASLSAQHALINLSWSPDKVTADRRLTLVGTEINALRQRGIRPFVVIGTWNGSGANNSYYPYWPQTASGRTSLSQFVVRFLQRYGASDYAISNEPNRQALNEEDLRTYCRNVLDVSQTVRSARLPGRLFGFGGSTNDTGSAQPGPTGKPLQAIRLDRFIAIAKEMKLLEAIDGVAVQAYSYLADPKQVSPEALYYDVDGTPATLRNVFVWKQTRPMMVIESGYPSAPTPWIDQERQSILLQRDILAARGAGTEALDLFEYADTPTANADPNAGAPEVHYGIVTQNFVRKQVSIDLQKLSSGLRGMRLIQTAYLGNHHWRAIFSGSDMTKQIRWSTTQQDSTAEFPLKPSNSL